MNKFKKILVRSSLVLGTAGIIVAGAAAFSAFEAHIVNVTARIENALSVPTDPIAFGTTFPQEHLTRPLTITLSTSFVADPDVTSATYTIKQKPKVKDPACADSQVVNNCNVNPTPGNPYAIVTVAGSFTPGPQPAWQYCEENLPVDTNLTTPEYNVNLSDPYWTHCYLPLANDLSKDGGNKGDTSVTSLHQAYVWAGTTQAPVLPSSLNPSAIAGGTLDKITPSDNWIIDLQAPCFVNQCAQEASDPNNTLTDNIPGFFVPPQFRLDPVLEGKVLGTDLWIEVTGITRPTPPPPPVL
jgi:hypothetical protein